MEIPPQLQSVREAAFAGNLAPILELLNQTSDLPSAIDVCHDLVIDLYWKQKNITSLLPLGTAAISRALAAAGQTATDPALVAALRKDVRILSYNVASFCWPGWNEPGITLTAAQIQAGRDLAHLHLQLVTTYELQPLTLSRAHWLAGAHLLAARDFPAARQHFTTAANHAQNANSQPDHLLNQAYTCLTDLLQAPSPASREQLDEIKAALKNLKDGDEYILQLNTAEISIRSLP